MLRTWGHDSLIDLLLIAMRYLRSKYQTAAIYLYSNAYQLIGLSLIIGLLQFVFCVLTFPFIVLAAVMMTDGGGMTSYAAGIAFFGLTVIVLATSILALIGALLADIKGRKKGFAQLALLPIFLPTTYVHFIWVVLPILKMFWMYY